MAKILARLCLALVLVPLAALAAPFEEGKHYQVLEEPQATADNGKVLVETYFWYGCPHCYQIDPVLSAWAEQQPDDVDVESVPALFGGLWNVHGQMFFALKSIGQLKQTHAALFEAVHQRQLLKTEEQMIEFLTPLGVDAEQFSEAFNSFEVRVQMQQAASRARAYGIQHVPLVIVNGKYVTDVSMAQGPAKLTQVLDYLIELER